MAIYMVTYETHDMNLTAPVKRCAITSDKVLNFIKTNLDKEPSRIGDSVYLIEYNSGDESLYDLLKTTFDNKNVGIFIINMETGRYMQLHLDHCKEWYNSRSIKIVN